jgi:hypothetical protein
MFSWFQYDITGQVGQVNSRVFQWSYPETSNRRLVVSGQLPLKNRKMCQTFSLRILQDNQPGCRTSQMYYSFNGSGLAQLLFGS